ARRAIAYFAETDIRGIARDFTFSKIDNRLQDVGVRLDDAIVVGTVEVFDVSSETGLLFVVPVERPQNATFEAGKTELVAGKAVELRLLARCPQVVLVILDHGADDVAVRRQLRRTQGAKQQAFCNTLFVFIVGK